MIGFFIGVNNKTCLAEIILHSLNVTEIPIALHLNYTPYVKSKNRCKP